MIVSIDLLPARVKASLKAYEEPLDCASEGRWSASEALIARRSCYQSFGFGQPATFRTIKFDASGKAVKQWPIETGWEPGEYLEPFLATDVQGNVYATEPTGKKVVKYSTDGQLLGQKSGEDGATLALPTGITIDSEGNAYVVDTRGNGVIKLGASGW